MWERKYNNNINNKKIDLTTKPTNDLTSRQSKEWKLKLQDKFELNELIILSFQG